MTAVEPALRQVSYARCAQGSTGDCDQPSLSELWLGRPFSASLQQPVDFFCKEIMPGQHRWEAPLLVDGSELIVERPRTPRNGLSSLNHQLSSLNRFPLA